MGLIKSLIGSAGGTLADQWKEYFYCEALDGDTLAVRGTKRTGSRSSNTKGSDNIISNGSGIVVADGQCMMIVDNGKVVELCAESGQYTYDKSSEPSIFYGGLGKGILDMFKTMGRRFTYGGDEGRDQRVYYFNTKEILDNKFGTSNPVPFRVVDSKLNLDLDAAVRCSGVYSYKITDPLSFYTNICGNFTEDYTRDKLDSQLKSEFISALQPAFGALSDLSLRPYQIVNHTTELEEAMNKALSEKWGKRGLSVATVAINSLTVPEDVTQMIQNAQKAYMMSSPTMAAGTMVEAQASAMKSAASNTAGAFTGFMGMNMAQGAGGVNINTLFDRAQKEEEKKAPEKEKKNTWKCSCGAENDGLFCSECGKKKPTESKVAWICSCGTENYGKFCTECGKKKPEEVKYRCSNCGFVPSDPTKPPRFCPQCGDKFGDEDIES